MKQCAYLDNVVSVLVLNELLCVLQKLVEDGSGL